jgi:hypothetical protein
MEKKERNSSLELLRIIAIILIFWMHGASSYRNNQLSAWLCIVIETIGNIGVALFVLTSGYFGIKLKPLKMIRLEMMLLFYCWIGLVFRFLWGEAQAFDGAQILSYIFPVIGRYSWYFTCYFVLVFLSPFLNDALEKLDRKTFEKMLITMLTLFSGVTTFFFFDITQDGGKGIVNMVLLYIIGRYIRLYKDNVVYGKAKLIGGYTIITMCCILLNAALYICTGTVQNRFARDNSLFTIAEAVCVFIIFKSIHFENNYINKLATHVPAIFIMEWTLRGIITRYMFDYLAWRESNWHELILFGISLLLVIMGACIDTIRVKIFGTLEEKISNIFLKFFESIKKFIEINFMQER